MEGDEEEENVSSVGAAKKEGIFRGRASTSVNLLTL